MTDLLHSKPGAQPEIKPGSILFTDGMANASVVLASFDGDETRHRLLRLTPQQRNLIAAWTAEDAPK